jgi:hypothetical protein
MPTQREATWNQLSNLARRICSGLTDNPHEYYAEAVHTWHFARFISRAEFRLQFMPTIRQLALFGRAKARKLD